MVPDLNAAAFPPGAPSLGPPQEIADRGITERGGEGMKFKEETRGDVHLIRLRGQLMGGPDANKMRETVLGALERGQKNFLVDLQEVPWINSTGLGILVSSLTTVKSKGGTLKVMRLSNRVGSLFMTTNVNLIFEVFDSEEEALASFAG
jgi:anti-sigma B factor antagonist